MRDQIYLVLILIIAIFILSRFIVKLFEIGNQKTESVVFYFRILLGFLIAMLVYILVAILKGQNVMEKFFGG